MTQIARQIQTEITGCGASDLLDLGRVDLRLIAIRCGSALGALLLLAALIR